MSGKCVSTPTGMDKFGIWLFCLVELGTVHGTCTQKSDVQRYYRLIKLYSGLVGKMLLSVPNLGEKLILLALLCGE